MLTDQCTVYHQHCSEVIIDLHMLMQCCSTVLVLGLQNCEDLPTCETVICRTAQITADTDACMSMTSDTFTEVCYCGYVGTYMCLPANA